MTDPFFQLWFAVRYVHVASVAVLAGGALIIAASCVAPGAAAVEASRVAAVYEWTFWLLAGLVAVTGVSNLGLKGAGLMGPATSWGGALTTKLSAVLILLALSVVRSEFVIRCSVAPRTALSARIRVATGGLYAATAAALLGVMWIGLGLAHGRY
jgi:hypothetical protein